MTTAQIDAIPASGHAIQFKNGVPLPYCPTGTWEYYAEKGKGNA